MITWQKKKLKKQKEKGKDVPESEKEKGKEKDIVTELNQLNISKTHGPTNNQSLKNASQVCISYQMDFFFGSKHPCP